MGGRPGGPTLTPKLDWELVNGNIDQSLAYAFGFYEPVNGSWIQAMCATFDRFTRVLSYDIINGSWDYTFLINIYQDSHYYNPELKVTLINENIWQSVWYYLDGESVFDTIGLSGINYAVNGSWKNTIYQLFCSLNGGVPVP